MLTTILIITSFISFRFVSLGEQSQKMQVKLGVTNNLLLPCKSKLNCLSTSDKDTEFTPKNFQDSPIKKIALILKGEGLQIKEENNNYLYALAKSSLFGFIDDVEFFYDGEKLHYRSASRVGKSDLGANKKRIENIFSQLKTTVPNE